MAACCKRYLHRSSSRAARRQDDRGPAKRRATTRLRYRGVQRELREVPSASSFGFSREPVAPIHIAAHTVNTRDRRMSPLQRRGETPLVLVPGKTSSMAFQKPSGPVSCMPFASGTLGTLRRCHVTGASKCQIHTAPLAARIGGAILRKKSASQAGRL